MLAKRCAEAARRFSFATASAVCFAFWPPPSRFVPRLAPGVTARDGHGGTGEPPPVAVRYRSSRRGDANGGMPAAATYADCSPNPAVPYHRAWRCDGRKQNQSQKRYRTPDASGVLARLRSVQEIFLHGFKTENQRIRMPAHRRRRCLSHLLALQAIFPPSVGGQAFQTRICFPTVLLRC